MNDNNLVEVDFNTHCPTCKYADLDEVKDPCNECLSEPANEGSTKPIKWEEKNK